MPSNNGNNTDFTSAEILWKLADALRGPIDVAGYKHVVLGLAFLKYICRSCAARHDDLKAELGTERITGPQLETLAENRDEYTADRVLRGPYEARCQNRQNHAARPDIATLIDDVILAVERDHPKLKAKLPRDYVRCGMASEKIQGLIDLISDIGSMGDSAKGPEAFGRVLAYFLGKFSQVERKLGSEWFAPRCIVRPLVEMLGPYEGRYYYPSGGSSGMFMQAECLVEAHGKENTNASIYCQ